MVDVHLPVSAAGGELLDQPLEGVPRVVDGLKLNWKDEKPRHAVWFISDTVESLHLFHTDRNADTLKRRGKKLLLFRLPSSARYRQEGGRRV